MTQNHFNHEQDDHFNYDFNDEDEQRFLQNVPLASNPQYRYHTCGWKTGQVICSSLVQFSDLPEHLRSCHGVACPDHTKLVCRWVHCFVEMKKECLMRHIIEKHLEVRYACPHCPEQFTRLHTLQNHINKKHTN